MNAEFRESASAGATSPLPTRAARRPLDERMGAAHRVGCVAGDVAHELGNHLQVVLGNAELLALAPELSESARRKLAWIVEAGRRASAANAALLALARDADASPERDPAPEGETRSLAEAIERCAASAARLACPGAAFELALDPRLRTLPSRAVADPAVLRELLGYLVLHARRAAPPDVASTLRASLVDATSDRDATDATDLADVADALDALHTPDAAGAADGAGTGGATVPGPRAVEISVETSTDARVPDGADGASEDGRSDLVADILRTLLERVGGRLRGGRDDGAPAGFVAVLPVEPRRASP